MKRHSKTCSLFFIWFSFIALVVGCKEKSIDVQTSDVEQKGTQVNQAQENISGLSPSQDGEVSSEKIFDTNLKVENLSENVLNASVNSEVKIKNFPLTWEVYKYIANSYSNSYKKNGLRGEVSYLKFWSLLQLNMADEENFSFKKIEKIFDWPSLNDNIESFKKEDFLVLEIPSLTRILYLFSKRDVSSVTLDTRLFYKSQPFPDEIKSEEIKKMVSARDKNYFYAKMDGQFKWNCPSGPIGEFSFLNSNGLKTKTKFFAIKPKAYYNAEKGSVVANLDENWKVVISQKSSSEDLFKDINWDEFVSLNSKEFKDTWLVLPELKFDSISECDTSQFGDYKGWIENKFTFNQNGISFGDLVSTSESNEEEEVPSIKGGEERITVNKHFLFILFYKRMPMVTAYVDFVE